MVFAFLLCCHLLVGEGKLEQRSLEQLVTFLQFLKKTSKRSEDFVSEKAEKPENQGDEANGNKNKPAEISENQTQGKISKPKPQNLTWLNEKSWNYFVQFQEEFSEMQGKANPYVNNDFLAACIFI